MLNDATAVNKEVVAWLEAREARLPATNGTKTTASINGHGATSSDFNRSRSSTMGTKDSQDSVGDLIDGYGIPS
jgi:hypothetical protein